MCFPQLVYVNTFPCKCKSDVEHQNNHGVHSAQVAVCNSIAAVKPCTPTGPSPRTPLDDGATYHHSFLPSRRILVELCAVQTPDRGHGEARTFSTVASFVMQINQPPIARFLNTSGFRDVARMRGVLTFNLNFLMSLLSPPSRVSAAIFFEMDICNLRQDRGDSVM